jgi:undecaprenyl-diphosphatase
VSELDRETVLWLAENRVGWLDPAFVALSVMGFAGLLWIALAPLVAARRRLPVLRTTVLTAASVWCADLLALALKAAVGRPRPAEAIPGLETLIGGTVGASFPSGHAATSFAGAVFLGLLAPKAAPLLLALAVAVAFSRVYAGVHYPSDVLVGAALGAAVGAAVGLTSRPRPSASPRGSRERLRRG